MTRAQYFGLERALMDAMSSAPQENDGGMES